MKNLYRFKFLLVVLVSSMIPSWTYGQFADPIHVNLLNSGSSFSDQFAASTGYFSEILDGYNEQLGLADIVPGSMSNTLKVTFTPNAGAQGSTDVIATYYTLSAPMHQVTRIYRITVADELVLTGDDKYVVDIGATDVPLDVLANDSITNGQLTISTVSVSNAGNAAVNSNGDAILFTPNVDFEGDTWIQYIACDSAGINCGQASIHVLVRDPNLQDSVIYQKYLLNSQNLHLLTPFEDFSIDIAPLHGTLTTDGASGWVYIPEEDYTGQDTFQLGLLSSITRKFIITIYEKSTNTHARNDKFYVRPGLSVTFNVLNNDFFDYDVSEYTNPAKGTISEVDNGVYTYTPNTGYRGVDKFTYTTCFQDTVYCETATVLLHVTDLEPDNVFSYSLQTSKDLPLTIDYPIEYTDFSYIIYEPPQHGELVYHAGVQQINLPCDTLESYNMLVYEPNAGYTGTDHFEYYYCIEPSNLCSEVIVDMNVIEEPEPENCPCIVNCVWPGDSDQNGRVDMSDLLTLGNRLGDSGPDRDYSDPSEWFGQHAQQWTAGTEDGAKVQYLDGNGDGTITADDVDQISNNYYNTHDVVVRDVNQKLPYQFSIIPVQFSLDSGDLVILDIALGNATNPVIDLKGAKFSINMPEGMMDSASVTLDFHQDSWLAEGSPFISLGKVPWDGRIDGGFARAKGPGGTGFGIIATTTFIITDDLEGFKTNNEIIRIPVTLQGGSAMDRNGTIYDVAGDEFILEFDLHANNQNKYNLLVYPNPAQDLVDIHLNGKTEIESITLIDPQGRLIQHMNNINLKNHQMDISSLPVGLYYIQVKHSQGMISRLLSVIR